MTTPAMMPAENEVEGGAVLLAAFPDSDPDFFVGLVEGKAEGSVCVDGGVEVEVGARVVVGDGARVGVGSRVGVGDGAIVGIWLGEEEKEEFWLMNHTVVM